MLPVIDPKSVILLPINHVIPRNNEVAGEPACSIVLAACCLAPRLTRIPNLYVLAEEVELSSKDILFTGPSSGSVLP